MREPDNNGLVIVLDDGSTIGFDAIQQVNYSMPVEAAQYAVELGGERVYRVNALPVHVQFDARVMSIDVRDSDSGNDRDLIVWDRLQYIRGRGELVTLMLADGMFEDMLIVDLERIDDASSTDTLVVSIEFMQARLGALEEVDVPAQYVSQPSGARKGSQRRESGGKVMPEDMTAGEFREAAQDRWRILGMMG